MGSLGEAVLDLTADASKLDPGLSEGKNKVTGALGGLKGVFGDATGTMLGQLSANTLRDIGNGIMSVGKDITGAAIDAEQAQAQLEAVIKSTGGAAGVTAAQVNDLANRWSQLTMFDDEAIVNADALLLTFTNIGQDVFPDATQAILDMSQAMGQDLGTTAIQVGKALNDPIQGASALRRVGVQLTDDQEKLIKKLVESGDVMGAQKIILAELTKEFGGSAEAAGQTMAGQLAILNTEFENVKEEAGTAFLPVLKDLVGIAKEFIPYLRQAVEWFSNLPTPVKTGVVAFLALVAVLGPIIGAVTSIIGLATVLGPVLAGIGAAIAPILPIILAVIAVVALLYLAWKTNFMGIRDTVQVFVDVFKHLWNAFIAFLHGDTKTALAELGAAWKGYWDAVKQRFQAAGDWIRNAWKAIGDFLKSFWQTVWNAIVSYVQGKINEAVNNVRNMINLIKAAFNINWLELGKKIIDGIIAGLKAGAKAVVDAVKAVAKAAIDAAKNALGIKSPSAAFAEIGQFSGMGFTMGFQKTLTPQAVSGTLMRVMAGARQTMNRSLTNNITINNPAPEPASQSTDRTMRRMSYLGIVK